jgi:hypothetical protein
VHFDISDQCPLLAPSGHTELHWHMSAFRAKADTTLDGVAQLTLSLTDLLWGVGAILYKAHVDPARAGSST